MQINIPMVAEAAVSFDLTSVRKGSYVASKNDDKKWEIATVLSKGAKNIKVETHHSIFDVAITSVDKWLRNIDVSHLKPAALKKALKGAYTLTELKQFAPPKPEKAAKPAKEKVTKPVTAKPTVKVIDKPKYASAKPAGFTHPASVLKYLMDARRGTQLSKEAFPDELNADTYRSTMYGRTVHIVLGTGILVGTAPDKNGKMSWIVVPSYANTVEAARGGLRTIPVQKVGPDIHSNQQVPYKEFLAKRDLAHLAYTGIREKRADHSAKSHQVALKFDLVVGHEAQIKFDDGTVQWHVIQGVNHAKQTIAIKGSRTKMRHIPLRYIVSVRNTAS